LIVDDNETNRQILKLHFESWGMKVLLSASGAETLALMKGVVEQPVIAVFDMQMPGMDGIELADIFKSDELLSKIPLLLLSSTGDMEHIPKNLFVSRLSKPVKLKLLFDEVLNIISELTRKSRMNEAAFTLDQGLGQRLPLKILIAEDNIVNQKLAISLLNMMGYRVDSVMNGKEVLDILGEKDFDIIFMDIQMPEMNGIEATIRIFETIPVEKQPLVIAITANAMVGDREKCLEVGMVDYMAKPIKIAELQKMIEKWGAERLAQRL
jgi:CheY-like chemotaxis protein